MFSYEITNNGRQYLVEIIRRTGQSNFVIIRKYFKSELTATKWAQTEIANLNRTAE